MAVSLQSPADVANEYATFAFIVRQFLNKAATAQLVTVKACTNSGGLSPWGTVDVIPLVNQVTGDGTNVAHGTVYRLPYSRIQGGQNAIIIDPEKGDVGLAVFAMRDISAVKADPAQAVANAQAGKGTPPGSLRILDMADGLYFGGFMNVVPAQYIQFLQAGAGIKVVSPAKVTIQAPEIDLTASTVVNIQAPTINLKGTVAQTAGNVTAAQNLTVTGDVGVGGGLTVTGTTSGTGAADFTGGVTGAGKVLQTHTHPAGTLVAGATPVTGNTASP